MTFNYTSFLNTTGSSNLRRMWYNEASNDLVVQFNHSDQVYGYSDVPQSLWDELVNEQVKINYSRPGSVGRLYTNKVKGIYKGFNAGMDADEFQLVQASMPQPVATIEEKISFVVTGTTVSQVTVEAKTMEEAIALVQATDEHFTLSSVSAYF